jgi:hypothetical protein
MHDDYDSEIFLLSRLIVGCDAWLTIRMIKFFLKIAKIFKHSFSVLLVHYDGRDDKTVFFCFKLSVVRTKEVKQIGTTNITYLDLFLFNPHIL